MADNTWLSFIFNYGSRKITVSSGRWGKVCCPCRCSGSGKLAVPGFPHGRLSYRTDRCLFAFPGSEAPFRDIRVPESCLLPEIRELPAFLHSHTGRGSTPFPGCFRQYPFIFPVFPAHIPSDRITVYAGISGISSGKLQCSRGFPHMKEYGRNFSFILADSMSSGKLVYKSGSIRNGFRKNYV